MKAIEMQRKSHTTIREEDAVRIFKCLSNEYNIKIHISAYKFSDASFSIGLITSRKEFIHMCYVKNTARPIWIEISVPIKEWESFHRQEHAQFLNIALNAAMINDVMFYDNTGEHVLIRKGTTIEELLIKADLRA